MFVSTLLFLFLGISVVALLFLLQDEEYALHSKNVSRNLHWLAGADVILVLENDVS